MMGWDLDCHSCDTYKDAGTVRTPSNCNFSPFVESVLGRHCL